jgi:hypothetical protein
MHASQKLVEAQLRENYGKVVYSHKTQEKCADILTKRNNRIKIGHIVLSALVTTGLVVRIFEGVEWALTLSTVLSAIQFGLVTFLKEYNLGETIQKHNNAAMELWDVREQYLSLLTDFNAGILPIEEIVRRRDQLHEKLTLTYKGSPRTFSKAYRDAQSALQLQDELTFSDAEIDKLLPGPLRTTSTK